MSRFYPSKTFSLLTNIVSIITITVIGSTPWMLISHRFGLALLNPLTLFTAFVLSDRYQSKISTLRTVLPLAPLILIQILLIHFSVIPEASPNHRTLFRILLISIIPLIFLITRKPQIRRVIAINFLMVIMGLVVVEGVFTVFSPKRSEQIRWSDLASQFSDAPIAEASPVVTVHEQFRKTKFQPELFKHRILLYGGSTTFNREVSDGDTYPSLTQKLLNQEMDKVRVENRGIVGATTKDLASLLTVYEADDASMSGPNKGHIVSKIKAGDIVVFYVGVNEAKSAIVYRDPITRLSLQFSNVEEVSNWLFKQTNVGYLLNNLLAVGKPTIDEIYLAETEAALKSASDFVTERRAVFIPIIQPHAFTKSNPISYEQAIRTHMGQFPEAVDSVYPRLADLVLSFENGADARNIFDNLKSSPYFDWCHVNKVGNQNIAEFVSKIFKPFINKAS